MCYCDTSRKRKDSAAADAAASRSVDHIKERRTKPTPKTPRKWKVWEDVRLIVAARRYGVSQWKHVASEVGNSRNHMQVLQRWKAIIEPAFSEVKWSQTEDAFLRSEVSEIMNSENVMTAMDWRQVAARMPFRSGAEIEARWYNHLADSKQKLHYTPSGKQTYKSELGTLEEGEAPPPFSVASYHQIDDDSNVFSPPPPPPPPPTRLPQTQEAHIASGPDEIDLHDKREQKKQATGEDRFCSSATLDAFNCIDLPLSATDLILYDEIKQFLDLPCSDKIDDPFLI